MVNCNINTSDHFCKYTVLCVCVDLEYNLTCPRVCWSSFTLAEISLNPRKDTTLLAYSQRGLRKPDIRRLSSVLAEHSYIVR